MGIQLATEIYPSKEAAQRAQKNYGGIVLEVDGASLIEQATDGNEVHPYASPDHKKGPSTTDVGLVYGSFEYGVGRYGEEEWGKDLCDWCKRISEELVIKVVS